MKRVFVLAAVAALMVSTRAGAETSDNWFNDGVAWYEHPCGIEAFAKYGDTTNPTPEVREAYLRTLQNPELCSKLLP
jgi:hypothetical protein